MDRVWVVAEAHALDPHRPPSDPVERTKLAVLSEEFRVREEHVRQERVRGDVLLRLYVRASPEDTPADEEPPRRRPTPCPPACPPAPAPGARPSPVP